MSAPQLLDLCDRAVGEVSRRRHLFGWLRAPGAEEWLAVDAYYPGHRLVVVCRERPGADDELLAQRVPEHGLRLLVLAPDELARDPIGIEAALRRQLNQLGPLPTREAVGRRPEFVATQPVARSRRQPVGRPAGRPVRGRSVRGRSVRGRPVRGRPGAPAPRATRRHPVTAALLIAALVAVVVIAIAIVTAAHG